MSRSPSRLQCPLWKGRLWEQAEEILRARKATPRWLTARLPPCSSHRNCSSHELLPVTLEQPEKLRVTSGQGLGLLETVVGFWGLLLLPMSLLPPWLHSWLRSDSRNGMGGGI